MKVSGFARILALSTLGIWMAPFLIPAASAAPARQSTALVQVATNAAHGPILVDAQGMTLYDLSSEAGGTIKCTGQCLTNWPPLLLPAGTTSPTGGPGVTGQLGVVARPDGTQQVTYDGFPLYRFAGDTAAGQTNGDGIQAFGGTWHFITPVPLAATAVERVVIHITTTGGTVWGSVVAHYKKGAAAKTARCSKSTCTWKIPSGTRLRLSETAADSATWPFKLWQIRPTSGHAKPHTSKGTSVTLRVKSGYSITALYVVA